MKSATFLGLLGVIAKMSYDEEIDAAIKAVSNQRQLMQNLDALYQSLPHGERKKMVLGMIESIEDRQEWLRRSQPKIEEDWLNLYSEIGKPSNQRDGDCRDKVKTLSFREDDFRSKVGEIEACCDQILQGSSDVEDGVFDGVVDPAKTLKAQCEQTQDLLEDHLRLLSYLSEVLSL